METSIEITSCVQGFHVDKDIWTPIIDKQLTCQHETGNAADPYTVAVIKNEIVVGHIPRKISTMCYLFLRKNGIIICTVLGTRRYSSDLAQGGMEIPCKYTFTGEDTEIKKIAPSPFC